MVDFRRTMHSLGSGLCVSLMIAVSAGAAEPGSALARVRASYADLDFEGCVRVLDRDVQRWMVAADRAQYELYAGLCHASLGHMGESVAHFDALLALEPDATLPPQTSPKIVALFVELAARRATRVPSTSSDAPRREPAHVSPLQSALLPRPGATVLRRARAPVWVSAGVGLAATSVGVYSGARAKSLERDANRAGIFESERQRLGDAAQRDATLANIAWGTAALSAIATGVLFVLLR